MALGKSLKNSILGATAHLGLTLVYYIAIVMFGAPILSNQKETLMLSMTLTALTLTPTILYLGNSHTLKLFTGTQFHTNGYNILYVQGLELNLKAVLIGTWFGAFLLVLDWDRWWQAWPIPCLMGAILGCLIAVVVTIFKIYVYKVRRKSRRNEMLKSC